MKNNLICDPNTGVCGVGDEEEMEVIDLNQPQKTIDVYYVTDPMCSLAGQLNQYYDVSENSTVTISVSIR